MRWIQQTHVGSQRVVDDSPSESEELILLPNVLDQEQQRTVRLVHDEAAVEILE